MSDKERYKKMVFCKHEYANISTGERPYYQCQKCGTEASWSIRNPIYMMGTRILTFFIWVTTKG